MNCENMKRCWYWYIHMYTNWVKKNWPIDWLTDSCCWDLNDVTLVANNQMMSSVLPIPLWCYRLWTNQTKPNLPNQSLILICWLRWNTHETKRTQLLGPLCLWQCLECYIAIRLEDQTNLSWLPLQDRPDQIVERSVKYYDFCTVRPWSSLKAS